jgi:acetylornithine deacetylase
VVPHTVPDLLARLVEHDTRNPQGDEQPLIALLRDWLAELGPEAITVERVPRQGLPALKDSAWVLARWGRPRLLINVHIDTVPANAGYSRPPHEPVIRDGRLYGLGSADTKGAAAALLVALAQVEPRDLGILFSGDEERASACIRQFLASDARRDIERVVVCEPTRLNLGVRHRGVFAGTVTTRGRGGHSSRADEMDRPIVTLARIAVALDQVGRQHLDKGPAGMKGLHMNVAALEGGVAFNVVPTQGALTFCLRPPPGTDMSAVRGAVDDAVATAAKVDRANVEWKATLDNPPFATRDPAAFSALGGAPAVDLDYWTEAALFAQAGIDAVVFGPGDIAQAHGPDEYVALDQLEGARAAFTSLLGAQQVAYPVARSS